MREERHSFTVDEANELLSQLKVALTTLRRSRDRLQELERKKAVEELAWLQEDGSVSPQAQTEIERLDQLQQEEAHSFEEGLKAIHRTGAELKDLSEGLIDFPTQRGKEWVYLCWKEDEEKISHWHDLESGFGGRRPIEQ